MKDIEWDKSSCAFWNNTVKSISASGGRYKYMKNVLWPHGMRFRPYLSCTLGSAEYGREETKCFVSKKQSITAGNFGRRAMGNIHRSSEIRQLCLLSKVHYLITELVDLSLYTFIRLWVGEQIIEKVAHRA